MRYGKFYVITAFVLVALLSGHVIAATKVDQDSVAEVNGVKIKRSDFELVLKRYLEQLKQIYGKIDANIERMAKQLVLDEMIKRELLIQEAKKRGIKVLDSEVKVSEDEYRVKESDIPVSDQEVEMFIRQDPAFMTAGRFDPEKYRKALSDPSIDWKATRERARAEIRKRKKEFIEKQRKQFLINWKKEQMLPQKLENQIKSTVTVTEKEVRDEFLKTNEKVVVKYVYFDPNRYMEKANVDEKELQEYFEKNKTRYKKGDQVKIKYILFNPDKFKEEVKITEKDLEDYYNSHRSLYTNPELVRVKYAKFDSKAIARSLNIDEARIKEYYELHKEEYKEPEQVRARHILIKVPEGESSDVEGKAKGKAEEILKEIRGGADFAEMARKYSEDPGSAANGGDLGYFKRGTMVKEFEEKAFAMNPGEISDPVRTKYGYHIIKVEDKRPERIKPLEEVIQQIKEVVGLPEGEKEAQRKARELEKALKGKEKDFEKIAKEHGADLEDTGLFGRGSYVPGIGIGVSDFEAAAFGLKNPGDISGVVKVPDGYCLLYLVEKKPSGVKPLSEVKDMVREEVIKEKSKELADKKAREVLEEARKKGEKIEEIAKRLSLEVKEAGPFEKGQYVPDIGFSADLDREAFSLKNPGDLCSQPVKTYNGSYIISLVEKIPEHIPTLKDVESKVKDDLKREKAEAMAKEDAERFRKELSSPRDFENIARSFGLEVKETKPFTRGQYIEDVGFLPDFEKAAFSLKSIGDISGVVNTRRGPFILRLSRREVDEEAYRREKEKIRERLLKEKQDMVFNQWYDKVRKQAKITIYLK
jgi:parvulin-like peptidyl-prolyl isomerase